MARFAFRGTEEYALKLAKLGAVVEETAKRAIYEAAKVVTDEIRSNIERLPEDKYRYLRQGEKFDGVPPAQKKDLLDSLGITPVQYDKKGFWNVKIGFDGYGRFKTKKYSKGVPNQLLARAIESGSSVRRKIPFVRPAVRRTKDSAIYAMSIVIEEEFQKIIENRGGK